MNARRWVGGTAVFALVDVVFLGGLILVENIDVLLSLLIHFDRLADLVGWISESSVEVALTFVTMVAVVVLTMRIVDGARRRIT